MTVIAHGPIVLQIAVEFWVRYLAILVRRTNNRFYNIYGYLITAVNNEIDESIEKRNDLLVYIKLFTI